MNGFAASQLDIFLNFGDLRLLVFSPEWRLAALKPLHRNFLGWDDTNAYQFKFLDNFLAPNQLDLSQFLGHFNQKDYVIKKYFWKDPDGRACGPFETYFRIKKENGQIKSLSAFVKHDDKPKNIEVPPQDKYQCYLAKGLPGFIHNFNGPLGTLTGRIELMNLKNPNMPELNEILKMGFRLQGMLENLSYKLVNEKYHKPNEINLNRLLREELAFLNSDLFFKHQVVKQEKYFNNIPQFKLTYLSISGVFSEAYQFFRNFVRKDREYIFQLGSFLDEGKTGFYVNFLGDFFIPEKLNLRFPVQISGDYIQLSQLQLDGLDITFLAHCLKQNQGKLSLSCRKERCGVRLEFPLTSS